MTTRRPAFDLHGFPGLPVGLAIDAEDCVWVAFWRGGAVRRFTPDGRLLEEIAVPVARTTSCCCLGGPDLRDLYVTSARHRLTPEQLRAEPLAGSLLRLRPGVRGRAAQEFGG